MKKINYKNKEGISVLIAVLIMSSVALLISLTYTLISVDENLLSLDHSKFLYVSTISDACVDDALFKINQNHNYNGEELTINEVSCTISVSGSGENRNLNIKAEYGNEYNNEIDVEVDWSSGFQITNWQNVIN